MCHVNHGSFWQKKGNGETLNMIVYQKAPLAKIYLWPATMHISFQEIQYKYNSATAINIITISMNFVYANSHKKRIIIMFHYVLTSVYKINYLPND